MSSNEKNTALGCSLVKSVNFQRMDNRRHVTEEDFLLLRDASRVIHSPKLPHGGLTTKYGINGVFVSKVSPSQPQRQLFFALTLGDGVEQMLPLPTMRQLHPQMLLDYLLANALHT